MTKKYKNIEKMMKKYKNYRKNVKKYKKEENPKELPKLTPVEPESINTDPNPLQNTNPSASEMKVEIGQMSDISVFLVRWKVSI